MGRQPTNAPAESVLRTHPHGHDKIARPLLKSKDAGDPDGAHIRDERLDEKDDRDDGQLEQFRRRQLGRQLGENYIEGESVLASRIHGSESPPDHRVFGSHLLKHGVKRATFKLATNFCESASNMPRRATI